MSKDLPKDWIGKCPILLHGVHGMTCQVCPDSSSLNKDLAAVVHWRLKGPKPGLAWLSNDDDQWCRARALITQWPKLSGRVLCRAGWCQVGYKAARAVLLLPIPTLTCGSAFSISRPASCFDSPGLNALWLSRHRIQQGQEIYSAVWGQPTCPTAYCHIARVTKMKT